MVLELVSMLTKIFSKNTTSVIEGMYKTGNLTFREYTIAPKISTCETVKRECWTRIESAFVTSTGTQLIIQAHSSSFSRMINKKAECPFSFWGADDPIPVSSRSRRLHHAARVLCGYVRWTLIWGIWTWRAWRLPGRWPDGGGSTVVGWTRRRAAPAYTPVAHATWYFSFSEIIPFVNQTCLINHKVLRLLLVHWIKIFGTSLNIIRWTFVHAKSPNFRFKTRTEKMPISGETEWNNSWAEIYRTNLNSKYKVGWTKKGRYYEAGMCMMDLE